MIKGFNIGGNIERVDYESLENLPHVPYAEDTNGNAVFAKDIYVNNNISIKELKETVDNKADLDESGRIPPSQLPSYVDDVLEFEGVSKFPTTGESGKIYVDTTSNISYRWGGSTYVEISPSLALGITSSTAYRGDRGKIAYDHSQSPHDYAPSNHTHAVDTALNTESENPVQNKVIAEKVKAIDENIESLDSKDLFETKHEEGNAITVSDSAEAPFVGMKLYGKTTQATTSGKNLIDCSISTTSTTSVFCPVTISEGNYILSMYNSNGTTTGIVTNSTYSAILMDADKNVVVRDLQKGAFVSQENATKITQIKVNFDKTGYTGNSTTVYGQLESGLVATPYEQYTGGIPSPNPQFPQELKSVGDSGSFEVGVYGKNVLEVTATTQTVSGVTFTVNADKSITVKGTATEYTRFMLHTSSYLRFPKGNYKFSRGNENSSVVLLKAFNNTTQQVYIANGDGVDFNSNGTDTFGVFITVDSGATVNTTVYPMIRLATVIDNTYEQYKGKQSMTFTDNLLGMGDIKDEKDFTRGITTQRFKEVEFDGSDDEVWSTYGMIDSGLYRYHTVVRGIKPDYRSAICSHFKRTKPENFSKIDEVSFSAHPNNAEIHFFDEHTTLDEFKAWLAENPIKVVYRLETPIETPISETELNAYRQLHTNKPNTTILSEADMEVDYVVDSTSAEYIENRLKEIQDKIPTKTSQLTNDSSFINQTGLDNALEDKLSFDEEVVNSTSDVSKVVPEGSGKYAAINKVGGMSYKTKNLIPYPYVEKSQTTKGLTINVDDNGTITINGTAESSGSFCLANNPIYVNGNVTISAVGGSVTTYYLIMNCDSNNSATVTTSPVTRLVQNSITGVNLYWLQGTVFNNTVIKPQIEEGTQATSYEHYYSGLRNAYVTEIKSVGKNLIDINKCSPISVEKITINGDNIIIGAGSYLYGICWRNPPLEVGQTYTFSAGAVSQHGTNYGFRVSYGGSDYVGKLGSLINTITITKPVVQLYFYIDFDGTYTTDTIISNIQVELGTEATEYTPYKENTFTIPTGARGVGYGMGINESCYNYIDFERKVYVQRCKKVNLGSLTWQKNTNFFATGITNTQAFPAHIKANLLCTHYEAVTADSTWVGAIDKTISINQSAHIHIVDKSYTDAASLKAALADTWLIYPLATPEETDISDYIQDNFIEVAAGGVITAVNEYGYNVPTEYEFYTSENPEKVIVADKIVGDLVGSAEMATQIAPKRYILPASQYMDTLGQGLFYTSDKDGYSTGRYYYIGIALGLVNEDTGEYMPAFKPNPVPDAVLTKIYNAYFDYASGESITTFIPSLAVPNGEIYFKSVIGKTNIQTSLSEIVSLCSSASGVTYNIVHNYGLVYMGDALLYGAVVHFNSTTEDERDSIDEALDTVGSLYLNKEIEFTIPLDIGSTVSMSFNTELDLGS